MSDLPPDVADEAERLPRLARRVPDGNEAAAYRRERDRLLGEHGYVARVREEGAGAVLVCYPEEWVEDGTARLDRIEDTDRAIERRLDGTGEDDWEAVESHNRDLVAAVEREAGDVHAANVAAFADFMGNHYRRRIEAATAEQVREFLSEYFPRNAWPTDEQRELVEESVRLAFEVAGREPPI